MRKRLQLPPGFVSVYHMAERLDVHIATVRRMIARGELRGVKIGRDWRIPLAELHRLIDEANLSANTIAKQGVE